MGSLLSDAIKTAKNIGKTLKKKERPKARFDNYGEDFASDDVEPDNSRWELEYGDVLDRYEHTLKNEKLDSKGRWFTPKGVEPRLNDMGVCDIMSDLRSIMHKGTALGNINEQYAKAQTEVVSRAFAKKLVYNTLKWGVEVAQRKNLVLSYANQVYMTLTRPIGDKERKHRSKKYQMSENYKHDEVSPDEITGRAVL